MSKEKLTFSFHSLLSFLLYIFSYLLYFSPLLLALTYAVLQDCTSPQSHLLGLLFSLGLHIFTPPSNGLMPLLLLLHLFLLSSLSHSSYHVTINASQLILTLLQPISFLQLSLSRMTLAFCFFLFFLPSNVSHKFIITYSFMWLDFCTSLHKCCWTFIHNYRRKDEPNFSLSDKLLQAPASSICFVDFLPIFQQAHLMSQDKVWAGPWRNAPNRKEIGLFEEVEQGKKGMLKSAMVNVECREE